MRNLIEFNLALDTPIDVARDTLCSAVDERAESIRRRYVGSGIHAVVLAAKAVEAASCATDPNPTEDKYPLLAASRDAGEALSDVATAVLNAAALWTRIAALTEGSRIRTRRRILVAPTITDAIAAFDAEVWMQGA